MKLVSRDGGYAELRVVAYEFETPPAIATDDDDECSSCEEVSGWVRARQAVPGQQIILSWIIAVASV